MERKGTCISFWGVSTGRRRKAEHTSPIGIEKGRKNYHTGWFQRGIKRETGLGTHGLAERYIRYEGYTRGLIGPGREAIRGKHGKPIEGGTISKGRKGAGSEKQNGKKLSIDTWGPKGNQRRVKVIKNGELNRLGRVCKKHQTQG